MDLKDTKKEIEESCNELCNDIEDIIKELRTTNTIFEIRQYIGSIYTHLHLLLKDLNKIQTELFRTENELER